MAFPSSPVPHLHMQISPAAPSRGVPVGPGPGPGVIVPDSRGALDGEIKRRCVLPPAEGGRGCWGLSVACWRIFPSHKRAAASRESGCGRADPPRLAGRRGRAALCLQGFSAGLAGVSPGIGLPSPIRPPSPQHSSPAMSLAFPRRPAHTWAFPTGGCGTSCSYFSARAGAEPRVKVFPPPHCGRGFPAGLFALGTHRGPGSLGHWSFVGPVRADLDLARLHRFTSVPRSAALREKS